MPKASPEKRIVADLGAERRPRQQISHGDNAMRGYEGVCGHGVLAASTRKTHRKPVAVKPDITDWEQEK
jgi:hypothetical protein